MAGKYSSYPGYDVGMGITKFQDFLFAINDRPERRLIDEELTTAMHDEHPTGKLISPDFRQKVSVRTVRRAYNIGTQNHGPAGAQSWP